MSTAPMIAGLAHSLDDYEIHTGVEWNGRITAFVKDDTLIPETLLVRHQPPRVGEKYYIDLIGKYGYSNKRYRVKKQAQWIPGLTLHITQTGHFGHFLLEGLARLWPILLAEGLPIANIFFDKPVLPVTADLLRHAIPASIKQVHATPKTSLRFEQLIVPLPSYRDRCDISPFHPRVCKKIAQAMLKPMPWEQLPDLGFILSRRRAFDKGKEFAHSRPSDDPRHYDDFLQQGYIEVYPELLTFEQQLVIANTASHLVGPIGSAFHLILFRENPRRLRTTYIHHNKLITHSSRMIDTLLDIDAEYRLVAPPVPSKSKKDSVQTRLGRLLPFRKG
ncbi:MAG: glycosyltransferase family 61 protein [Haliea sp.]|nr:glycosyltransferase family 61 protein [Haliea sp.]